MKTAIIIPARYASSRLPGKPLLRQTGKYLVQHVYERACQAQRANHVVVATDDPRIVTAVESFGGNVVRTRRDHSSGTDRVAEVAGQLDADLILNLQGDEPLIDPSHLDRLFDLLIQHPDADMATLATPLRSMEQWQDPNCVKVVSRCTGPCPVFQPQSHPLRPRWPARLRAAAGAVPSARRTLRLSPSFSAAPGRAAAGASGATGETGAAARPGPRTSHPGRRCRAEWLWRRYLRGL